MSSSLGSLHATPPIAFQSEEVKSSPMGASSGVTVLRDASGPFLTSSPVELGKQANTMILEPYSTGWSATQKEWAFKSTKSVPEWLQLLDQEMLPLLKFYCDATHFTVTINGYFLPRDHSKQLAPLRSAIMPDATVPVTTLGGMQICAEGISFPPFQDKKLWSFEATTKFWNAVDDYEIHRSITLGIPPRFQLFDLTQSTKGPSVLWGDTRKRMPGLHLFILQDHYNRNLSLSYLGKVVSLAPYLQTCYIPLSTNHVNHQTVMQYGIFPGQMVDWMRKGTISITLYPTLGLALHTARYLGKDAILQVNLTMLLALDVVVVQLRNGTYLTRGYPLTGKACYDANNGTPRHLQLHCIPRCTFRQLTFLSTSTTTSFIGDVLVPAPSADHCMSNDPRIKVFPTYDPSLDPKFPSTKRKRQLRSTMSSYTAKGLKSDHTSSSPP